MTMKRKVRLVVGGHEVECGGTKLYCTRHGQTEQRRARSQCSRSPRSRRSSGPGGRAARSCILVGTGSSFFKRFLPCGLVSRVLHEA